MADLAEKKPAVVPADRRRTREGLLSAVGVLDILIGLWLIGEPWALLAWSGGLLLAVGVLLLVAGNLRVLRSLSWRTSALVQFGFGRLTLLVLTGLCLASRFILRAFGIG